MKVLIISRGIPSERDPMWGNFEMEQAEAISELGHKVAVFGVDKRTRIQKRKIGISVSSVRGIDTYSIFIPLPYILFPARLRTFIVNKIARILYRKVETQFGKPDIIHAHYLPNIAIAVSLGEALHIPIVATEHWSKVNKPKLSSLVNYLGRKYYKRVNQLIAVSESLSRTIHDHFGVKSEVIDNMCSTDVFAYDPTIGAETTNSQFVFVAVGRLDHNKGYDILIESFYRAQLGLHTYLQIIGSGTQKKALINKVTLLGLENQVKFLGLKTKEEIAQIMQRSQAFCLTSRSETFGVAYIEAMAAGLPVIATRVGATETFVNEKTGILVDIENIDQTSTAMKSIYNGISTYNRSEISMYVRNRYSPESVAKRIENIYIKSMQ